MGNATHNPNQIVDLPRSLSLPFLVGLTAQELIKTCDWHIAAHASSFAKDQADGLLDYYALSEHPHDWLCCLVPPAGAPRPSEDAGIPRGLAKWLLRREVAADALPQQDLRFDVAATRRPRSLQAVQS